MGIEIVKAAAVYGNRLSGNAYKVLVAMSVSALDKPSNGRPASLYWGGWDALAMALGHPHAQRDGQGHKAVKRAIKELREAEHITAMVTASRGTRQSYMVHPGGLGKGAQEGPVKGAQIDPVMGAQKGPQRGPKEGPPRKDTGVQGQNKDTSLPVLPQPQTARPDVEPHKFQGVPGNDCGECGRGSANRTVHPLYLAYGGA